MNTRQLASSLLAAATLVATAAAAHEGHRHNAMGTVKAVDATTLTLETKDGKVETFVLGTQTVYKRAAAATRREDVRTGERAVVTYETKQGRHLALEVRLSARPAG